MWYDRYVHKLIELLGNEKIEEFEKAIITVIPKLLAQLCKLKLSVKLDVKKTLLPVFYASFRKGFSVSQAVKYLREKGYETHSAKYILDKIRQLKAEQLKVIFDCCRELIFTALSKCGYKKRRCLIAIDYHDKPFYGNKELGHIVGCKRKASTNFAHRYITACIVEEGIRFNLACLPITQLDIEQDSLKKVIQLCRKYAEIGCLLLDRGFNSVANYKFLEDELKVKYIMPQQSNEKLKRLIESNKLSAYTLFEYVFNENLAEEYRYGAKLFYIIAENGKKYTFVTNINADNETLVKLIVQCYDKRWGIETGYRTESHFWCKTTSKSFNIRTFLGLLSFFLQDLWTFKNYLSHKKIGTHEPRAAKIINSKTLADFLTAVSEKLDFVWKPIQNGLMFCESCCDTIICKLKRAKLVSC